MDTEPDITTSRRRMARVAFRKPRGAKFGMHDVLVLDISLHGAGVQHPNPIKIGTEGVLRFRLEKQRHEVRCRILRSRLDLQTHEDGAVQTYRSGLVFTGLEDHVQSLREALRKRAHRAVLLQQANALARPELADISSHSSGSIDIAFLAPWLKAKPFIKCTLERKKWRMVHVSRAEQPDNGFTVLADEGEREIEKLCKIFESATAEQRNLIQLFAHLSIAETSDEERGRFDA